jgi:MFS transporter, PPP family, 3-phenylpropionic acid transporter
LNPLQAAADAITERSIAWRLAFFYAALSSAFGVIVPFWPAWLAARGLDATQIGLLLSLGYWIKLAGNPILASLADRHGDVRRILIALAFANFAFFALFGAAHAFLPILAVTIAAGLGTTAMTPLGDSLAMHLTVSHGMNYGRVRLWGSLAYVLAGLLAGLVLAGRAASLVLPLSLCGLAASVLSCLLLPRVRLATMRRATAGWLDLLRDRRFLLFILATGLVQSSHAVLYGFGTLHWLAAGYGKDVIGLLWALGTGAEIFLFLAGSVVFQRLGASRLLILGAVAGAIRWSLAGMTTSLPLLVVVQLLHALTFGASHLAAMYFLTHNVPPGLAATAQGVYGAVAVGAVFGLTMLAAGGLYESIGGVAFFAMAGMCIAAAIAGLCLRVGETALGANA